MNNIDFVKDIYTRLIHLDIDVDEAAVEMYASKQWKVVNLTFELARELQKLADAERYKNDPARLKAIKRAESMLFGEE